jgi:hypothetical protein
MHVIADLPYYEVQYLRVQAYDESGNAGPWSEVATGYTTPLVDRDIILSTIDAAKTHLKNINAGVSILPNTIITEHLVVTEEMTAAIANFLYIKSDKIDVNSLAADTVFTGLLDAKLVRSDMFVGKEFVGGTFTGNLWRTHAEEFVGVKMDPAGIVGYAATGGVETFRLSTADGSFTASKGTLTGLKYQTHLAAAEGIKIDPTLGIKSYNASGQLQFDISSSGATFTGTIKSGFTSTLQAVLSNNVYSNQPGVQFNLGLAGWTQPFITAWATNNNFASGQGMLHMSSARSGSNYSEIYLSREGVWQLGSPQSRIFGFDTGIQITAPSGRLDLQSNGSFLSYGSDSMFLANGNIGLQANTTTVFGALQVNGAKNFVMDHPTKPGMQLLHGSTESPVSGVEYWGCGTTGADGTDIFHLPEYFTALVKPGTACIGVWGNGAQVEWSDIADNSVTVTGPAATKYMWLVKAERIGGDFDVEREKSELTEPVVPVE